MRVTPQREEILYGNGRGCARANWRESHSCAHPVEYAGQPPNRSSPQDLCNEANSTTRVATRATSSRLCETNSNPNPSRSCTSMRCRHNSACVTKSSIAVDSSQSKTAGRVISARTMQQRMSSPPESSWGNRVNHSSRTPKSSRSHDERSPSIGPASHSDAHRLRRGSNAVSGCCAIS